MTAQVTAIKFGNLFEFIRNGMSVKQDKSGDGLPITRIETISQMEVDSERVGFAGLEEAECKKWLLQHGDILFSHINSVEHIGKCAVYRGVPEKLVHGMNLLCLRPNADAIRPEFAKYLIKSGQFRARLSNFINKAVNQASVSIGNLKTIKVEIPNLDEQKRIAEVLDRAEALRARRRAALALLDELTQSIFLDMFGDPVTNPRGWPVRQFDEACVSRLGKMLDAKKQTGDNWRPYMRNINVGWGKLNLSTVWEMDFDEKDRKEFRLRPNDILICEGGAGVAQTAIWRGEIEECYFQKSLHRVRPKEDVAAPEYIAFLIRMMMREGSELMRLVSSATIPHLTGVKLKSLNIPVPSLGLQRRFGELLETIERIRSQHQEHIAQLDELFTSLQSRAFKGELFDCSREPVAAGAD